MVSFLSTVSISGVGQTLPLYNTTRFPTSRNFIHLLVKMHHAMRKCNCLCNEMGSRYRNRTAIFTQVAESEGGTGRQVQFREEYSYAANQARSRLRTIFSTYGSLPFFIECDRRFSAPRRSVNNDLIPWVGLIMSIGIRINNASR